MVVSKALRTYQIPESSCRLKASVMPYLPNEILSILVCHLGDDIAHGCALDDSEARKWILRCRLINKTWNDAILYAFLHKLRITSGFFPRDFDARNPRSALRIPCANGISSSDEFSIIPFDGQGLMDLHRSNWFCRLSDRLYEYIHTLTVEASCTFGDTDPKTAVEVHTEFASAALHATNLQVLKINCHGQLRIDHPDNGLDTFFGIWDLALPTYQPRKITEATPWPSPRPVRKPGIRLSTPVFPKLRELHVIGKSGSTYLSTGGLGNLLHFIYRHKATIERIFFEDIAIKIQFMGATPDFETDRKNALALWSKYKKHTIVHYFDWPYETDVVVSSKSTEDNFHLESYDVVCGCQTDGAGPESDTTDMASGPLPDTETY
ncbi:hypothetical protein ABW21_db0207783 [Orbilia brochopaga]|nr:hypothetical protein ABW21_db0207783 [Drechslerella brochopaga]